MYIKHAEEIAKYIESKFPDIPVYVAQDISVFASYRAVALCNDAVNEYIRLDNKRSMRYGPTIKLTRVEETEEKSNEQ